MPETSFMKPAISVIDVPPSSRIGRELAGADFFDAYAMPIEHGGRSALDIYLQVVAATPAWVNCLMAVRNRIVSLLGLKDLGHLGNLDRAKDPAAYRVGDRVGIFSILSISEDEVVLGDADRHLDVKVSFCKLADGGCPSVAVTTVVHIHNLLGRIYMLFVAPIHKLIVPATLARATERRPGA